MCVAQGLATPSTLRAAPELADAEAHDASQSTGLPWKGKLRNGVLLRISPFVRYLPKYRARGNFYGTEELVGMLKRAAHTVARDWPGSRLSVGELSARRGGYIEGHHSHRNGRDADIAFFMRGAQGDIERFWRFVEFDRYGPIRSTPTHLRFDDARNWSLVRALLRDPDSRVQYLFVAKALRTRLLMEGRRQGESDEFLRSAAAVLVQPKRGHQHANHFHLRIFCSRDDRPTCRDRLPYWPWYEGRPPNGEYASLPTIHWKTATASARTTHRQF